MKMPENLKILAVSDFDPAGTGFYNHVVNLTKPFRELGAVFFSNYPGSWPGDVECLGGMNNSNDEHLLIFSHLECSSLPKILRRVDQKTIVHVADWPLTYWISLVRNGKVIRGLYGSIRFFWRTRTLPKHLKYIFVSELDCLQAKIFGYNSAYLPLGVNVPNSAISEFIDDSTLIFSGNFRYEPNRIAAENFIKLRLPDNLISRKILVGYAAKELVKNLNLSDIETLESVESVIDVLATRRPIYVSLLTLGAGAKNKILEAISAGCPVIATSSSLDTSLESFDSIIEIKERDDVVSAIQKIKRNKNEFQKRTIKNANKISNERSWVNISRGLLGMVCTTSSRERSNVD
jgi:glycosyltransferase involved in cell wall biosynthesis